MNIKWTMGDLICRCMFKIIHGGNPERFLCLWVRWHRGGVRYNLGDNHNLDDSVFIALQYFTKVFSKIGRKKFLIPLICMNQLFAQRFLKALRHFSSNFYFQNWIRNEKNHYFLKAFLRKLFLHNFESS